MSIKVPHVLYFMVIHLLLFAIVSPTIADERQFKPLDPIDLSTETKPLYDIESYTKDKPIYQVDQFFRFKPLYDIESYIKDKPIYQVDQLFRQKALYDIENYTRNLPSYTIPSKLLKWVWAKGYSINEYIVENQLDDTNWFSPE